MSLRYLIIGRFGTLPKIICEEKRLKLSHLSVSSAPLDELCNLDFKKIFYGQPGMFDLKLVMDCSIYKLRLFNSKI